jgi:DNA-binding transcriptional LysR family regulator
MGDVFGIIAGVEHGLGRAVVSRHLIRDNPAIRILARYSPVSTPVTLHFHNQPHYTRLHREILEVLCRRCPAFLDP